MIIITNKASPPRTRNTAAMPKVMNLPPAVQEVRYRLRKIMAIRLRRSKLKPREVRLLVAMRFGSVSDFSRIYNSWSDIGRRLVVNAETVRKAVTRYIANGGRFVQVENRGKARKVSQELEDTLCSVEKLDEYRFLSIDERLVRIEDEYGLKISKTTLKSYYKKNDIKMRQPKKVYRMTDAAWMKLIRQRIVFANMLEPLLQSANIIYMDQTSFQLWNRVSAHFEDRWDVTIIYFNNDH